VEASAGEALAATMASVDAAAASRQLERDHRPNEVSAEQDRGSKWLVAVIVQLARVLLPHLVQLMVIFLSVTALTLVLADVANAVR
jgi:hypothetical protein